MKKFYKLARPDGWDFYTGKTINYRENIGKRVKVPTYNTSRETYEVCSRNVIHASRNINDCFVGAKIPCSAYKVSGRPVVKAEDKYGFRSLRVLEEIPHAAFNRVFKWNILEAENPVHPFKLPAVVEKKQIALLQEWASVRASVWASVRDSVWAYIGSLFPNIKRWKYIEHEVDKYPFQPAVDLWRSGLVPSFNGEVWLLHGGEEAEILYAMKVNRK